MSVNELIDLAGRMIEHAKPLFDEVQFCCEDSSRTEPEVLTEISARAVDAGADVLTLPDTVGYALPGEYARLFGRLRRSVGRDIPLAAHCHDDLGLATANTLAAVDGGATQVECTINGIGERAGNAALEEVVASLELSGFSTGIDATRCAEVSDLVSRLTASRLLGTRRSSAPTPAEAFPISSRSASEPRPQP